VKRRTPPEYLTEGFFRAACERHGRVDWLKPFDEKQCPVHGRLEATHLISRQRVRNILLPQLVPLYASSEWTKDDVFDLVELAEWDPRNAGGLAYTDRHRRFDNQATPALRVPATALPFDFYEFVDGWGFELEACRRFEGYDTAVLGAGRLPRSDEARAA
jgi:hypothetical protein